MPLRSPKMKRFIFGFQRRVWCPKWTPASSICRMVMTAIANSFAVDRPATGAGATASGGGLDRVGRPTGRWADRAVYRADRRASALRAVPGSAAAAAAPGGRRAVGRHQPGPVRRAARAAAPGRGTRSPRGARSAARRRTCRRRPRRRRRRRLRSAEADQPAVRRPQRRRHGRPRRSGVPATTPLNVTMPAAAARTAVPGPTGRSSPRLPGHHGTGLAERVGDRRRDRREQARRVAVAAASAASDGRRAASTHDLLVTTDRRAGRGRDVLRRRRRRPGAPAGGARTWCGSAARGSR